MQTQSCPYCQSSASLLFQVPDLNRRVSAAIFDYYRCNNCGLIFKSPVPDDLGAYYPEEYYPIPETLIDLRARARKQQYKIGILKQYVKEGRLLEIGPSYGEFACVARDAGYQVDAIEMDTHCCEFLRNVVGINTINSSDIQAALDALGNYEIISLWQVIEHLPQPWEVLDSALEHLATNGVLVIATPNPHALQFRLFGKRWTHLDAPRHIQLIPMELMKRHLQEHGLRIRMATSNYRDNRGHDLYGWATRFAGPFQSQTLHKAAGKAGRIWGRLIAPLERHEPNGSTYVIIGQKV